MGEFSPWHLLIVALVFLVLFGANKLPQMARSVGQSMRIFKAETRAMSGEKEKETSQLPPTSATQSPAAQTHQSQVAQSPPPSAPAQQRENPPAG
ncbi:MAG: Sec-independent protein translocase subunit TatA [Pseudonocardiaceae bacterium]